MANKNASENPPVSMIDLGNGYYAAPVALVDGSGNQIVSLYRPPLPAVAADVNAPAAHTAAVVTYAAVAGKKHYLYGIAYSYSATPVGGNVKVEDVSGTTVFTADIAAAGPGQLLFDPPIVSGAANTAMIITLTDGGVAVTGKLSCRQNTA